METRRIMEIAAILVMLGAPVGAMPPALMPMNFGGGMTNWTATSSVTSVSVSNVSTTPILSAPVFTAPLNTTNATQATSTTSVTITKSQIGGPGIALTYGWIASTDPTGLGIRSNMDAGCTMYISLFGVEVYFQPYGLTC